MYDDMTPDEKHAVALYAVAARDFGDFVDMLSEPTTTLACIRTLKQMCSLVQEGHDTDHELNRLMLGILNRKFPELHRQMDLE
jgi:hypothetical protein